MRTRRSTLNLRILSLLAVCLSSFSAPTEAQWTTSDFDVSGFDVSTDNGDLFVVFPSDVFRYDRDGVATHFQPTNGESPGPLPSGVIGIVPRPPLTLGIATRDELFVYTETTVYTWVIDAEGETAWRGLFSVDEFHVITSAVLSPDGTRLFVGTRKGSLEGGVYEYTFGSPGTRSVLQDGAYAASGFAFVPTGDTLYVSQGGEVSGRVRRWLLNERRWEEFSDGLLSKHIESIAAHSDGTLYAVSQSDQHVSTSFIYRSSNGTAWEQVFDSDRWFDRVVVDLEGGVFAANRESVLHSYSGDAGTWSEITDVNTQATCNLGECFYARVANFGIDNLTGDVYARTSDGFLFVLRSPTVISLDAATPAQAAIDLPLDGLEISWPTAADATHYRLQVSTDPAFIDLIKDDTLSTNQTFLSGLSNLTEYFWRVRGINLVVRGPWSETGTFTTVIAALTDADRPAQLAPVDGAVDQSADALSFSWDPLPNATTYAVEYTASDCICSDACTGTQQTTTAASLTLGGLTTLTEYHWRVQGRNTLGAGGWSSCRAFTTIAPVLSQAPAPLFPADQSSDVDPDVAELRWSAIHGVTSYTVQHATNSGFQNPISDVTTDTTLILGALASGQQYYWRVRGENDQTSDPPWSQTRSFSTLGAPAAPTLLEPAAGEIGVSPNPTLLWESIGAAEDYRVQVADNADFSGPLNDQIVVATSLTLSGLSAGAEYYWRVSGRNRNGAVEGNPAQRQFKTYASSISLQPNRTSFAGADESQDFRLIGLPGRAATLGVATTFDGTNRADWIVYQDLGGADQILEYTGSFQPGRGYWALSKTAWPKDAATISTVELSGADKSFQIQLHDGWNIITNPFDIPVCWQTVLDANPGLGDTPLYKYDRGFLPMGSQETLNLYEGYYLQKSPSQAGPLIIPYSPTCSTPSQTSGRAISLRARSDSDQSARIVVGFDDTSANGFDTRDRDAPPDPFGPLQMHLSTAAEQGGSLAQEYRPEVGSGQEYEVNLVTHDGGSVWLAADIATGLDQYRIVLLDRANTKTYDLTGGVEVQLRPTSIVSRFSLLIGSDGFVSDAQERLRPERVSLLPNYPNPFGASTTIQYSVPEKIDVIVDVLNVLGQRVRMLARGERSADLYTLQWNGRDDSGAPVAAGVYFVRLVAGDQTFVQKAILSR